MSDVQYIVDGPEPDPAVLTAVDRLAATLDAEPGWRITVDIDPGTHVVATPVPVRRSTAAVAPENPLQAPAPGPADSEAADGRTT